MVGIFINGCLWVFCN